MVSELLVSGEFSLASDVKWTRFRSPHGDGFCRNIATSMDVRLRNDI